MSREEQEKMEVSVHRRADDRQNGALETFDNPWRRAWERVGWKLSIYVWALGQTKLP